MKEPKIINVFYRANTGEMFIVWEHWDCKPEKHGFILYRNGEKIAEHKPDDEKWGPFQRPRQFDHDHRTNLFRRDSAHQLVYCDTTIQRYQKYEYRIEKIRYNDNKQIVGTLLSRPVEIKAE